MSYASENNRTKSDFVIYQQKHYFRFWFSTCFKDKKTQLKVPKTKTTNSDKKILKRTKNNLVFWFSLSEKLHLINPFVPKE